MADRYRQSRGADWSHLNGSLALQQAATIKSLEVADDQLAQAIRSMNDVVKTTSAYITLHGAGDKFREIQTESKVMTIKLAKDKKKSKKPKGIFDSWPWQDPSVDPRNLELREERSELLCGVANLPIDQVLTEHGGYMRGRMNSIQMIRNSMTVLSQAILNRLGTVSQQSLLAEQNLRFLRDQTIALSQDARSVRDLMVAS